MYKIKTKQICFCFCASSHKKFMQYCTATNELNNLLELANISSSKNQITQSQINWEGPIVFKKKLLFYHKQRIKECFL